MVISVIALIIGLIGDILCGICVAGNIIIKKIVKSSVLGGDIGEANDFQQRGNTIIHAMVDPRNTIIGESYKK